MADYFKIVAVLKKRGTSSTLEYTYVPHKWEVNGILYWPCSNLTSLRSDVTSEPLENWRTYKCKVKKSGILGVEEAELWEEEFITEGTDAEGSMVIPKSKTKPFRKTTEKENKSTEKENEYEVLFEEVNLNECSRVETEPTVLYVEPYVEPPDDINSVESEVQPENVEFGYLHLNDDLCELKRKINKVIINQERLLARVDAEFATQRATYDQLYKMVKQIQSNSTGNTRNIEVDPVIATQEEKFTFPLVTISDVMAFNKEITLNEKYKDYLLKTYCTIGGTDGNEEGKIVAKKLRGIFFTDHVMTLFSWTGVSRTAGLPKKESFQLCDGIIKLFTQIIQLADSRWTSTKNEKFFKYNTLKHAKQNEKASENRERKHQRLDPNVILLEEKTIEDQANEIEIDEVFAEENKEKKEEQNKEDAPK